MFLIFHVIEKFWVMQLFLILLFFNFKSISYIYLKVTDTELEYSEFYCIITFTWKFILSHVFVLLISVTSFQGEEGLAYFVKQSQWWCIPLYFVLFCFCDSLYCWRTFFLGKLLLFSCCISSFSYCCYQINI